MKKTRTALLVFLSLTLVTASAMAQISKEAAYDIVIQQGLNGSVEGKRVFVMPDPVPANTVIETWRDVTITLPNAEGWFFFIDDHPFANWEHPCRYVFVDGKTGDYTEIAYKTPPKDQEDMEELTKIEVPVVPRAQKLTFPTNGHWYAVNKKAYAVIISGGYNAYNNWVRYWNDTSYIYQALTGYYGFNDKNIYVLMSDGTDPGLDRHHYDYTYDSSPLDLDFDGDDDVQYAATKANISTVFNELALKMDRDSYLFIFTTDHGGSQGGWDVTLCLWNETEITDDEFAAEVNKITDHAGMIITMEQCFSGGMIDDLTAGIDTYDPPRIIATACRYDESSWAMAPDYYYDEFVYYWTAAVNWAYPDGTYVDADTDGYYHVEADEAFIFARDSDTASETPQYADTSDANMVMDDEGFGDDLSLYFTTRRCIFQTADDKFKFKIVGKNKGADLTFFVPIRDDGVEGDYWQAKVIRKLPEPKEKDYSYGDGTLYGWGDWAWFVSGNKLKATATVTYDSGTDNFPARMNIRFNHYSDAHKAKPIKIKQTQP